MPCLSGHVQPSARLLQLSALTLLWETLFFLLIIMNIKSYDEHEFKIKVPGLLSFVLFWIFVLLVFITVVRLDCEELKVCTDGINCSCEDVSSESIETYFSAISISLSEQFSGEVLVAESVVATKLVV